jgi:hypothetical protein
VLPLPVVINDIVAAIVTVVTIIIIIIVVINALLLGITEFLGFAHCPVF